MVVKLEFTSKLKCSLINNLSFETLFTKYKLAQLFQVLVNLPTIKDEATTV